MCVCVAVLEHWYTTVVVCVCVAVLEHWYTTVVVCVCVAVLEHWYTTVVVCVCVAVLSEHVCCLQGPTTMLVYLAISGLILTRLVISLTCMLVCMCASILVRVC